MEGKLVRDTLTRLAERDGLDKKKIERLQEAATHLESWFDGLGFCLSEKGDLLSQWRGYANDARGVSIGFSRSFLQKLAMSSRAKDKPGFTLQSVEYAPEAHDAHVEPTYRQIRQLIDDGAFDDPVYTSLLVPRTEQEISELKKEMQRKHEALFLTLLMLFEKLYVLKTNAFREEHEWRLISFLVNDLTDGCLFRERGNLVIPYRKFDLPLDIGQPIVDVVLGPKHKTPPNVVARLLKQRGFGEIIVRRSEASYR